MLSTQQVLQSLIDMQANAQRALPVIPNNGNPMGANNMPRTGGIIPPKQQPSTTGGYDSSGIIPPHMRQQPGQVSTQNPMLERYPWLKPTSSMDNIRNYLTSRRGRFGQQPQQPQLPQLPHQPTLPGGIISSPVDPSLYPTLPAMPMRAPEV